MVPRPRECGQLGIGSCPRIAANCLLPSGAEEKEQHMDVRSFDNLVRAMALGGSRRQVIKGLTTGMVAGILGLAGQRRALAQQTVPIGGRCSAFGANSECSQAGTPVGGIAVICSDNGIARDGQFNCCRNASGSCTADFHCCGAAFCINGICGGGGSSQNLLSLGSSCSSTTQCSQSGGSVVCADNGVADDGARNCCRNQGGNCTAPNQCCGSLNCVSGVCGGGGSTSGLAPGAVCANSNECSQSGGAVVCADNGIASDGALNCCRNEGGACANSAGCCGGLDCAGGVCTPAGSGGLSPGAACSTTSQCSQGGGAAYCADNGIPSDGALNCCRYEGGTCTIGAGCCGALQCLNGICASGSAGGGSAPGAACSSTDQCSQSGGAAYCADNGLPGDGALNCCRYEGGGCTSGSGCCGGLDCVGGVCTPAGSGGLAPGASCSTTSQCSQSGGATYCADNGLASDGGLNCCRYEGAACSGGAGCCGGLECVGGVCSSGGAGGDLLPGASCSDTSQCSQAGGATYCADNGLPGDGALNCCRYAGGACTSTNSSAGCCAGLVCISGVCQ